MEGHVNAEPQADGVRSLADELVVIAQWGGAGLNVDDLPVLEPVERQDGLRSGTVGEVSDGVPDADLVVLKQDTMGFGANSTGSGKGHDVAFGHHGAAHVRVKFAVIVDDGVQLFFVSGFEGGFVLRKDAHAPPSTSQHITTSSTVHEATRDAGTFEARWHQAPP